MEEYIDEVNYSGKKINSYPKSLLKERMFLHKVCLVIPRTKDNKLVLSRRSKTKQPFPDTWCCAVGGKVATGESEEDAAKREIIEEVGLDFSIRRVSSTIYDEEDYKGIFTVFTSKMPVDLEDFKLDSEEIQYSKSFSLEEIENMMDEDKDLFAPTFRAILKDFIKSL